ncbi:DUF92 domain-containing protein [Balneola vulgaris]|uniref:DUF92 domain-containing protein n=1 Tax=Balneola vulgaris TaxID=287535 RepID=UPI0003693AC5|nr:DUF92 domain-containing protein [Balneola vulgaris]
MEDHIRIGSAVIFAAVFSVLAFLMNWLTYDGAVSAGIFGTIAYGLGDWPVALIVIFFFVSASLVSKDVARSEEGFSIRFRRDGTQVWANGFWLALWVLIWFITDLPLFLVAAVSTIAAATADTWATELGSSSETKTYLITDFKHVKAGTDGGISIYGTVAALLGSGMIAVLYWVAFEGAGISGLILISVAGFIGCLIDSLLGAKIQGKSVKASFLSNYDSGNITINNNIVNWLSTGASSILVLIIVLIFKI